jgi:hypothetical protein
VVSTTDPNGRILGFIDRGLDEIDVINTKKRKTFQRCSPHITKHAKPSMSRLRFITQMGALQGAGVTNPPLVT